MKWKYMLDETKILWHTRVLLVLIVAIMVFSGALYAINNSCILDMNDSYKKVVEFEKANQEVNEDSEEEGYSVRQDGNGVMTITNPLAYYRERLSSSYYASGIGYASSLACEGGIAIFPFLFGIFGIVVGSLDYKNRTVKYRVSRIGKQNYVATKVATTAMICVGMVLFYFALCHIMSLFFHGYVSGKVDLSVVTDDFSVRIGKRLLQLVFSCISAVIYGVIGLFLGGIWKGTLLGTVVIVLYSTVTLPFGPYDISNSLLFIANKICDFYGVVAVSNLKETTWGLVLLILAASLLLPICFYYGSIRKRSAYC